MKKQLVHIGPHQAGKIFGLMYFTVGIPAAVFLAWSGPFGHDKSGVAFLVAMPFVYGAIGYIFSILGAALYNIIARFVGGLEITVTAEEATHVS